MSRVAPHDRHFNQSPSMGASLNATYAALRINDLDTLDEFVNVINGARLTVTAPVRAEIALESADLPTVRPPQTA